MLITHLAVQRRAAVAPSQSRQRRHHRSRGGGAEEDVAAGGGERRHGLASWLNFQAASNTISFSSPAAGRFGAALAARAPPRPRPVKALALPAGFLQASNTNPSKGGRLTALVVSAGVGSPGPGENHDDGLPSEDCEVCRSGPSLCSFLLLDQWAGPDGS